MAEQNIHWTNDEEMVDRFLLGRVSPEEAAVLQSHLGSCAECSRRIDEERRLLGLLRQAGRRDLKERLKANTPVRANVPWPHILSIAAVFLVVIGVGLYTVWKEREPLTVSEQDVAAGQQQAPREELSHGLADQHREPAARGTTADETRAAGAQGRAKELQDLKKVDRSLGEVAAARPSSAIADEMVSGGKDLQGFWIQGQVVAANALGGPDKGNSVNSPRAMSQRESGTRRDRKQKATQPKEVEENEVTVQQQPFSALPVTKQQQFGAAYQQKTIPAMVQSTSRGMLLTIYTDDLKVQQQSTKASIVSPDSLIVEVDGTRIIFQIPSALQAGFQKKTPPVK